nr:MAG TPA: hypothetical protein [Caudoviricetes sp.]
MERLTYVAENGEVLFHPADLPDDEGITITQLAKDGRYKALEEIAERLANREQAEEQGFLLRLPYPLETEYIYFVDEKDMDVYELDAKKIEVSMMPISKKILYTVDYIEILFEDFGKIVFLTREEAEAKLKEMEEASDFSE